MSQAARNLPDPGFHEVAGIFPMMAHEEIARLAEDIRANGQKEPIYTHGGLIIDGRNRFMACRMAGVTPWVTPWNGRGSLVGFVVSLNLHRRHLDESQRSMVAAKIATLGQGARTDLASIEAMSQADAAEALNVGRASVQRARTVVDSGAPELVAEVEAGRVAVSTAADVATLPQEEQREIVAKGEREILAAAQKIRAAKMEARRQERLERITQIAKGNGPLPSERRWPILYADPPWAYDNQGRGAAEDHYPTMTPEAICALGVRELATPDAVLFLWATAPHLFTAQAVIDSWGFRYVTVLTWVKEKVVTGFWLRGQAEFLLIAKRGAFPPPAWGEAPPSVLFAPNRRHSEKPPEVAAMIEKLYPGIPKIELFARTARPGWDAWGNQSQTETGERDL